jgi:hypothetical protein
MADPLNWVVTADDKDIIAAFNRMNKELDKAKLKAKEAGDAAKKAEQDRKNGIEGNVIALGKMAMKWVSVQSAIQIATAEIERYHQAQKDAGIETVATADAQIKFFRNLGRVGAEESKKVQQQMKDIASAVQQPVKNVYAVATEAISAQGNLSREQMLENVKMALRLAPESVPEATALGGALGDVASLTGSGNAAENAGLMLGMGEQARIPSMQQIAKNLIPAAIGVKQSLPGTGTAEATALVSTLTSVMKDKEGALSGTASIALASQLDSFFGDDAKVGKTDKEGGLLKKLGDGTLLEQVAKLQNDPKAREAFFAKASFEGKAKPFVEELLTAGSPAARLFNQNRGKVPFGQVAIKQTDEFFANLQTTPEQQVANQQRAMAAQTSALQLANQTGASSSVIREEVVKQLGAASQGMVLDQLGAWNFDIRRMAGWSPEEAAVDTLKDRRNSVENEGVLFTSKTKDPEKVQMVARLDEMIAQLKGIRGDQKQPKKKNVDQHKE